MDNRFEFLKAEKAGVIATDATIIVDKETMASL